MGGQEESESRPDEEGFCDRGYEGRQMGDVERFRVSGGPPI